MDESALLSALKSLDTSWSVLEFWLWVSTSVVAAGVVTEVVVVVRERRHELREFRRGTIHSPEKPSTSKYVLESLGSALVALGVLGELLVGIAAAKVETEMRDTTGKLVALANREAKTAGEHAAELQYQAAILQKAFIESGPREVPIKASAQIFRKELRRFAGQRFRIAVCPVEVDGGVSQADLLKDEQVSTVNAIADVLVNRAGWEHVRQPNAFPGFKFPDVEQNCNREHINVYAREGAPTETLKAGHALMEVINEAVSDNVKFASSVTSDRRKYQGQPDDAERIAVFITVGINVNAVHPKVFGTQDTKK
jgi:hypothetical protein